jgi:hypothetical protein
VRRPDRRRALRATLISVAAVVATLGYADASAAAPWCGTVGSDDRAPAVAGPQIRLVYVVPSDGEDRSSTIVPQMSADVDAIEAWWQAQDPTRTARFDRALFPCGAQADVELLRMQQSGSQLQPTEGRFDAIVDAVTGLDGLSPYFKYVVYYDGPLEDTDLCGQGGGLPDGPGVAIVYVDTCTGEPSATVAAHELLHAMGALPRSGPQHSCGVDDYAHACDSNTDVMWPFATLVPLSSLILDVNRDDYYGHSGAWDDVQDSRWLRHLDAQTPLTVSFQGRGTVVSDIPGVLCTATCTTQWDTGSTVSLSATPGAGQRLVRWGGSCSGSAPSCTVSLAQAMQVSALFAPPTFGLRVAVSGRGTVRGGAGQVTCPARCVAAVPSYTPARLVATPAKGWRFKAWAGACRGTRPTCSLPMRKAATVRAAFARVKR